MNKIAFFFFAVLLLQSCKNEAKKDSSTQQTVKETSIKYAEGFRIENNSNYKVITVTNAWPGADKVFRYALVKEDSDLLNTEEYDAVIKVPVKEIVVTSTTHIPSLGMLNETDALVGFPNCDYISSEGARERISEGKIRELGKNESLNTEVLIDLSPDAVVTFAIESDNKTVANIEKTGIPVLYNGDWTETHPLGKAEWIKFFGALFNKEKEADSIFNKIETEYLSAKKLAQNTSEKPTVLAGAMYKDIWYLPQGDSWAAQFIEDANGDYLWKDSEGTGSLSLNLETVLEKGKNADFWIGPGQFTSFQQLQNAHSVYTEFDAFKNQNIFSFTNKKGETGGVIYYELAPNRPDLVLKDMIKILHPDVLPDYQLYFFTELE